jgi:hypothetical protein
MTKATRTRFRCVIVDCGDQLHSLCTGITVEVPPNLNRHDAINFVADKIAAEVRRYAASEALGLGPYDRETRWTEPVT